MQDTNGHRIIKRVFTGKDSTNLKADYAAAKVFQSHAPSIIQPGALVRFGTGIILLLFIVLLVLLSFIRYPDSLICTATISDPRIFPITVPRGGRFSKFYACENEFIHTGNPIAEIENNTGYEGILFLQGLVDSVRYSLRFKNTSLLENLASSNRNSLGDAEEKYHDLLNAVSDYLLQTTQHIYRKRAQDLSNETANFQSLRQINQKELTHIDSGLAEAHDRFNSFETLYKSKVISRQEYFEEKEHLRAKELALQNQKKAIIQNSVSISDNHKQLVNLDYEQREREIGLLSSIKVRVSRIEDFIHEWKTNYLIISPNDGRLHYLMPWQNGEGINNGEEICLIIPATQKHIAYIELRSNEIGAVAIGQKVRLYLDQFPEKTYGFLNGSVNDINPIPFRNPQNGTNYRITVEIKDLKSSFGRILPIEPFATARGEIITQEKTIFQRFISSMPVANK